MEETTDSSLSTCSEAKYTTLTWIWDHFYNSYPKKLVTPFSHFPSQLKAKTGVFLQHIAQEISHIPVPLVYGSHVITK